MEDNRVEIGIRDDWAELSSSIGVRGGRARAAKEGGAADVGSGRGCVLRWSTGRCGSTKK